MRYAGLNVDQVLELYLYLRGRGCGHSDTSPTDTRFIHSREWASAHGIAESVMHEFNESLGWMNCDCEMISAIEYYNPEVLKYG